MESKLKAECMDQSGELYENMLLKEGGFPHLPNPVFVPDPKTKQAIVGLLENKSDAWNEAGTKPDHPCLCETKFIRSVGECDDPVHQYWNGYFFCEYSYDKDEALNSPDRSMFQHVQWREVQP